MSPWSSADADCVQRGNKTCYSGWCELEIMNKRPKPFVLDSQPRFAHSLHPQRLGEAWMIELALTDAGDQMQTNILIFARNFTGAKTSTR